MQQFTYLRPEGLIGKAGAQDAATLAERYHAALVIEAGTFEDIGVARVMEWGNLGGKQPKVGDACDIIVKDVTGYRRVSGGKVVGVDDALVALEKDGHKYWANRLTSLFLTS